jgi:DnaK suppressor protein
VPSGRRCSSAATTSRPPETITLMAKKDPPIDDANARRLLQRERERIETSLADMKRLRGGQQAEIEQDADAVEAGDHIEEGQVDEALGRKLRSELEALERAEKRLEEGTYGFSVDSGEPIPRKRLEAIPWAERTEDEQERFGR